MRRKIALLALGVCFLGLTAMPTAALQTEKAFPEHLTGICVQQVPRGGRLKLGSRVLHPGDVLTAQQAEKMEFESDTGAGGELRYLPVFESGVLETASFWFPAAGDQPPVAEDSAVETYQNLPCPGKLRVRDEEQQALIVTLIRPPRRGTVTLEPGGTFTYTPGKNKVGRDSFSYQAQDPKGQLSREATVTVTILKPSEEAMYEDAANMDWGFYAQWLRNTGIFRAESLGDSCCFRPEKPVTRGEFLTMLLKTLEIPGEPELGQTLQDVPRWLRPYAAAAIRSGMTAGLPAQGDYNQPITQTEAAALIRNGLERTAPVFAEQQEFSAWTVENQTPDPEKILNRGQAAELLYQAHLCRNTQ